MGILALPDINVAAVAQMVDADSAISDRILSSRRAVARHDAQRCDNNLCSSLHSYSPFSFMAHRVRFLSRNLSYVPCKFTDSAPGERGIAINRDLVLRLVRSPVIGSEGLKNRARNALRCQR